MPANAKTTSEDYPIRFTKRETGETHWNVGKGVYETIRHAETGEPNSEYVLLATVDGIDVPILTINSGRLETIVRSQQQAQSADKG